MKYFVVAIVEQDTLMPKQLQTDVAQALGRHVESINFFVSEAVEDSLTPLKIQQIHTGWYRITHGEGDEDESDPSG